MYGPKIDPIPAESELMVNCKLSKKNRYCNNNESKRMLPPTTSLDARRVIMMYQIADPFAVVGQFGEHEGLL